MADSTAGSTPPGEVSSEDAKLVTLARAARLRSYVPNGGRAEGAAVRDGDGRSYVAATVQTADPALAVSALRAAVIAAAASGARSLQAAALVTDAVEPDAGGLAMLREFGHDRPVLLAGPDGTLRHGVSS